MLNPLRFLATLLLFLATSGSAWSATAADFSFHSFSQNGEWPLPYRLLLPPGYSTATRYPLIIFLHGLGEVGGNNTSQLDNNANGALALVSDANQAAFPCIMVAPQASSWWDNPTLEQVARLITDLKATYAIDPDRVILTGLSMGGQGTIHLSCLHPELFAAAVPMSGWNGGVYAPGKVTFATWFFHAADDGTVSAVDANGSDSLVMSLRGTGHQVIYTRYDTGGHGIWGVAYQTPELMPWMMAQRRGQAPTGSPLVRITAPNGTHTVASSNATVSVAGTAVQGAGITRMAWHAIDTSANFAQVTPGLDPGTLDASLDAATQGTTSWSVTDASVPAHGTGSGLFLAIASAPSGFAPWGGTTTANDYLFVTVGSGGGGPGPAPAPVPVDTTAPTVAITTPTAGDTFASGSSSIALSGTATDDTAVTSVTWVDDRGGSGTASGTTGWSIGGIALNPGSNHLTVTAHDAAGHASSASLVVTWSPPLTASGTFHADYFNGIGLSGAVIATGTTPAINFDWGNGAPSGVPIDGFSARWTGSVIPTTSETYTFTLRCDDGARLWLDGVLVIDAWGDHAAADYTGTRALTAGRAVEIVVEYYESSGGAMVQLCWGSGSVAKELVPGAAVAATPTTPPTPIASPAPAAGDSSQSRGRSDEDSGGSCGAGSLSGLIIAGMLGLQLRRRR